MKSKICLFFLLSIAIISIFFVSTVQPAMARENVTDWYIQNFDSEIKVNKDSTLDITEKITADCGACVGKHGIFRILPEDVKIGEKTIAAPVELISVTDFNGQKIKYTQTLNYQDDTIIWKIGDPDKTVQGVNYYMIRYRVKNAIRFDNSEFDELYWNLTGNFWELEIDKFHGTIVFPVEVTNSNSTVDYYAGNLGEKGKGLAVFLWSAPNVLEFDSTGILGRIEGRKVPGGLPLIFRKGITASVIFPKNIFVPYQPTLWEKYAQYLALLIPLAALSICFWFWWKYGKDPRVDKTAIAEYEIPSDLSPIETGMLMTNGKFNNKLITAEIVNLATRGLIKIRELNEKILFFNSKDYEITKINNAEAEIAINAPQRAILDKIFAKGDIIKLSELKNEFYKSISDIESKTSDLLKEKKLISSFGKFYRAIFNLVGIILIFAGAKVGALFWFISGSFFLSGIIILILGFFLPKRTPEGAELNWQIKGFKLFMETVDKDRAKFYEEQNIFEKFLPYAIVFGMTKLWIQKMKDIYGENYYTNYAPAWYAGNAAAFDADSFSTAISNLSSDIAANTSAPSGASGGGGSGGGGGGGGGW